MRIEEAFSLEAEVVPDLVRLPLEALEPLTASVERLDVRIDRSRHHLNIGMEVLGKLIGVHVTPSCRRGICVKPLDRLHVLLRHRLPGQPDGFEGGGAVVVELRADDLPVAYCPDSCGVECDLLGASLAASEVVDE